MNRRYPHRIEFQGRMSRALLTTLPTILLIGSCVLTSPLHARSSDREQEAEIDAGHWVDDPERGVQIFSRGVILEQGTLRIEAEKATVHRSGEGGFDRIVLVLIVGNSQIYMTPSPLHLCWTRGGGVRKSARELRKSNEKL